MQWIAAACVVLVGIVVAQETAVRPVAGVVRGRVVDENGKPIPGAVYAWTGGTDFLDTAAFLAKPPATTGEDGVYSLPTPTSVQRRLVIAAAGRQACGQWVHDSPPAGLDLGDVVLPPGARLVGRVRDERGAPLAGVRLVVDTSLPQRAIGPVTPQLLAGALSNDKGIFNVPCVPRVGLRLRVQAEGYLPESRLVAQESPIDLTLVKVGVVRGRVVDADGKPKQGVWVRPVYPGFDRAVPGMSVAAADDGAFVITVPCRGRFCLAANDDKPPYAEFRSRLLHGAAEQVLVGPCASAKDAVRDVEVRVIGAATKQPLPKFAVSFLRTDPSNVQAALFHGVRDRRECEGPTTVSFPPGQPRGLYIDAPQHGYEVVAVPEGLEAPLVVALGPEAVLRGRVVDAATGTPMAGVAVRALPKGNTSGSGGSVKTAGPLTDANGDYVLRGLRPGDYGVQAHAEGRAASPVVAVTLVAGDEAKLELRVPARIEAEVELTGVLPPGPVPTLAVVGGASRGGGGGGFFQHSLDDPSPVPLVRAGRFRFGPLLPATLPLQVFVPSRTRVGVGTTVTLGEIDSQVGMTTIALPDLTTLFVTGRIELPSDVPTERIVVLATRRGERDDRARRMGGNVSMTGIDAGGRFTIELPRGSHVLQLADLATGIVFHTEAEDVVARAEEVVLKPPVQWLTVVAEPATAGTEVVVSSFEVSLPSPRDGTRAFLETWGSGRGQQTGSISGAALATPRWLVPRGSVSIKALQGFDSLRPGVDRWQTSTVADASVDVDGAEVRVVLKIPDAPSDDELQGRR